MKITFKDLMDISESFEVGNEDFFIDFINKFKGDNVFLKFKNILTAWERDVSYTISMGSQEKSFSLQLSYFISELDNIDTTPMIMKLYDDQITLEMGIPDKFHTPDDLVPVYNIVKEIYVGDNKTLQKYSDLSENDKKTVIDRLPGETFNKILKKALNSDGKILKFKNPTLKDMKLNFLGEDPYYFLKNLFSPYSRDYYRNIIYYLANKITGNILLNSTMMDIEYYVNKMEEENKQNSNPQI